MPLTSKMSKSGSWTVMANGKLKSFADPEPDPLDLQSSLKQLLGRVSNIENTPIPTTGSVSALQTRVLTLEQVPSLQPQLDAMGIKVNAIPGTVTSVSQRVGVLEAAPSLSPVIQAVSSRVGVLEAAPAPPQISMTTPKPVAVSGSAGMSIKAAADDHTHASGVQRKVLTLAADGTASWTFTKAFTDKPSLQYMVFQASGAPVVVEVTTWIMLNGTYNGVIVKGKRSRTLPTLAPTLPAQMTLSALLTAVITSVNTLTTAVQSMVTSLSNYDIFGGGNLAGVEVHLSAGDQM